MERGVVCVAMSWNPQVLTLSKFPVFRLSPGRSVPTAFMARQSVCTRMRVGKHQVLVAVLVDERKNLTGRDRDALWETLPSEPIVTVAPTGPLPEDGLM